MSFRQFKGISLYRSRAYITVLGAVLIFLNPMTCFSHGVETPEQCCASKRCHRNSSTNQPDCCKVRLLANGQAFLTVAKIAPHAPVFSHAAREGIFVPARVLPGLPVAALSPREHSPPGLYTFFCSLLI
jgi:hypothetical protein